MLALAVLFVPMTLMGGATLSGVASIGVGIVAYCAVVFLAHQGKDRLAGWLLFAVALGTVKVNFFVGTPNAATLFYLVIPVLLAGVVMRPGHVWIVLGITALSIAAAAALRPELVTAPGAVSNLVGSSIVLLFVACMGFLSGRETEQALGAAAEHARHLAAAQAETQAQAEALSAQAEALGQAEQVQRALVAQLETPTVGIADGVMLAPIIGVMDSRRAQLLSERLLQQVSAQRCRLLIFDLTGLAVVDTAVAQALLQLVQSLRLLGCEVVITGISATVAGTITALGIDLEGVRTLRSPQDVLLSRVAGASPN
jgi:anti-anti-sigma regulatory factor